MRQPPEAYEQHQEQSVEACPVRHDGPFQVPAAAFEVLKGRFDAHSAGIRAHALPSGGPVGEDDPGLLLPGLPSRADLGRQWALLPELDSAIPLASALRDQMTARDPAACPAPTRGLTRMRSR